MKRVILSEHARFQMRERRINHKTILYAIANPDRKHTQQSGRIQTVRSLYLGHKLYCLVIIYEDSEKYYKVITVFITSKIRKYLRP